MKSSEYKHWYPPTRQHGVITQKVTVLTPHCCEKLKHLSRINGNSNDTQKEECLFINVRDQKIRNQKINN